MAQEPQPLKIDEAAVKALGTRLRARFTEFKRERREIEVQWMRNLRQFLGQYDPEMLEKIEQDRSRAYPKLTRVKVVSMVSRLMSLLFPTSEKNWGLQASKSPTFAAHTVQQILDVWAQANPQGQITKKELDRILKKAASIMAEKMEEEIDDQLMDIGGTAALDYIALVRKVVFSAVLYGPGVLKGPMTISRRQGVYEITPQGVVVSEQDVLRPYYESVSCWDYYPDLSAKSFVQMDGQFQRHVFSRHQLRKLADRDDFLGDNIKKYLEQHREGNYRRETYEGELKVLGGQNNVKDNGRKYEAVEYWGFIYGHELRAAGLEIADNRLSDEVRATVWMIDDEVIKAAVDPFPDGVQMYHQFVFEEDEVNLMGSGLPPICRDSQLGVCASTRMLVDNASVTCGPQLEVNVDLLRMDQDTKGVKPFKVWYREGDGQAAATQAVRNITIDSHIPELLQMVDLFMGFADKETFINPVTGGDMENSPSEPMRTSSGASMILGNAALPFRDIVRNFDQFTMSVMHSLVEWNRMFNPNEDIKGDLQPIARGATSLIAKEVRAMALDNLATTLRDDEAVYVDMQELAKARIRVRDLPTDRLLLSDDDVKAKQDSQAQRAQQEQQMQDESVRANIRKVLADAFKATSQAKKNLDGADATVFNAVLSALEKGMNPDVIKGFTQEPPAPVVQQPGVGGATDGQGMAVG
jgi:uncharacterized protein (UPF0147 family)